MTLYNILLFYRLFCKEPVQHGDCLGPLRGSVRSEGRRSRALGDPFLHGPEDRFVVISVLRDVLEGHPAADLGAARRPVEEEEQDAEAAGKRVGEAPAAEQKNEAPQAEKEEAPDVIDTPEKFLASLRAEAQQEFSDEEDEITSLHDCVGKLIAFNSRDESDEFDPDLYEDLGTEPYIAEALKGMSKEDLRKIIRTGDTKKAEAKIKDYIAKSRELPKNWRRT